MVEAGSWAARRGFSFNTFLAKQQRRGARQLAHFTSALGFGSINLSKPSPTTVVIRYCVPKYRYLWRTLDSRHGLELPAEPVAFHDVGRFATNLSNSSS